MSCRPKADTLSYQQEWLYQQQRAKHRHLNGTHASRSDALACVHSSDEVSVAMQPTGHGGSAGNGLGLGRSSSMRLLVPPNCACARPTCHRQAQTHSAQSVSQTGDASASDGSHVVCIDQGRPERTSIHPPRHPVRGGASLRLLIALGSVSCCVCMGTALMMVTILPVLDAHQSATAVADGGAGGGLTALLHYRGLSHETNPATKTAVSPVADSLKDSNENADAHPLHRMVMLRIAQQQLHMQPDLEGTAHGVAPSHVSTAVLRDLFPHWLGEQNSGSDTETERSLSRRSDAVPRLNADAVVEDLVLVISELAYRAERSSLTTSRIGSERQEGHTIS
jgi:hypothetical protein